MDTRIFHGNITPEDFAQAIIAHYNRGNLIVQKIGEPTKLTVQIATSQRAALSVLLQKVEDGVAVQIGKQSWMSVAASLSFSALSAFLNPWNLLGRLDDIAQDVESLQLSEEVWKVLDSTARSLGTGYELSARLKRMTCDYCGIANPVGQASCLACGAPLGNAQPDTCQKCGYVIHSAEKFCPNCGATAA
jgi:hypothetical protein